MSFIKETARVTLKISPIAVALGAVVFSGRDSGDRENAHIAATKPAALPKAEIYIEDLPENIFPDITSSKTEAQPILMPPESDKELPKVPEGPATDFAKAITEVIKEIRASEELPPLDVSETLAGAAQEESELSANIFVAGPEIEKLEENSSLKVKVETVAGVIDKEVMLTQMKATYVDPDTQKAATAFIMDIFSVKPEIKKKLSSRLLTRIGVGCSVILQHGDASEDGKLYISCTLMSVLRTENTVSPTATPIESASDISTPTPSVQ